MAQILVINSINSGSGKTLLAAHFAVMLAKEYNVCVCDSAGENSPLAFFIAKRYTLNLSQNFTLKVPQYHSLRKETFADLLNQYDVVILDAPDEKYFKYADIFITPLSGTEGLNSISDKKSLYASLLWEAKKQRAAQGKNTFKWVIIPNDDYTSAQYKQAAEVGKFLGFGIAPNLEHRTEYTKGLSSGVTVFDKDLPELKSAFELADLYARRNLKKLANFIWQNK